jgi:hypothetical protein
LGADEVQRRAVGAAEAGEPEVDLQIDLRATSDIVDDEQVQVAVAVVVEEGGAGRPGVVAAGDAGGAVMSSKRPAGVAEQVIGVQRGQVQIIPAVAVESPTATPMP